MPILSLNTPLKSLHLSSHHKSSQPLEKNVNIFEVIYYGALQFNDVTCPSRLTKHPPSLTGAHHWSGGIWCQIESRDVWRSQLAPYPPLASCSVLFELWLVTCHVLKGPAGALPPSLPVTTGLHMLLIGVCSSSLRAFHCLIMVEAKLQKQMKGFLCATAAPCMISFSLFEWCKIVLQSQYMFFKVDIHNKLQYLGFFLFCLFFSILQQQLMPKEKSMHNSKFFGKAIKVVTIVWWCFFICEKIVIFYWRTNREAQGFVLVNILHMHVYSCIHINIANFNNESSYIEKVLFLSCFSQLWTHPVLFGRVQATHAHTIHTHINTQATLGCALEVLYEQIIGFNNEQALDPGWSACANHDSGHLNQHRPTLCFMPVDVDFLLLSLLSKWGRAGEH